MTPAGAFDSPDGLGSNLAPLPLTPFGSLPPLVVAFSVFRVAVVAAGLLGTALLWRRPRPFAAVLLVLAMHVAAWAAYTAPLGRLYALEEHLDQAFNVGIAACAAAGNSPFDHTQVRFASLDPIWAAFVAALSLHRPERVLGTYYWMPPLGLILVGLGLYFGLRTRDDPGLPESPWPDDADRWERALIVFAALGLSSFSMSQRPPIPALWPGNFLLKPNHAVAWGLIGVVAGMRARGRGAVALGVVLGLLAWVFILDWAYLLPGLFLGVWLRPPAQRDWRRLLGATLVSTVIATPFILHLARDYSPLGHGESVGQIWKMSVGLLLAPPHWATVDLGLLLVLGVIGALVWRRRGEPRDAVLLGMLGAAWVEWIVYQAAVFVGVSPEPDEHHYFLRFAMSLAAGAALAAAARHLERHARLLPGRGHVLALAACLPLSFPAYWDPPTMDRYYQWSLPPLRAHVVAYGRWVLENTPRDAVFLAGRSASAWIPVLAGRRVLLAADTRPPADYPARKEAERLMLLSRDPALIRAAAQRMGVTHVAVDRLMVEEYGEEALAGLGKLPCYEPLYYNAAVRILRVR
jgi:hypothetical protein